MDLSFISLWLTITLVLFLLIFAGVGALRGLIKSAVSLGGNIISVILAVVLTPVLVGSVGSGGIRQSAKLIMASLPDSFQNNADIEKLLTMVISMAGAALTFTVVYFVLFLLLKIPQIFINMAITKAMTKTDAEGNAEKKSLTAVERITGALVCAVSGFIFFIVMFSTTVGLVFTAGNIASEFVEDTTKKPLKNKDFAEIAVQVKDVYEMIQPVAEAPVMKIVNTLGGKAIYNYVTTVKNNDKKLNLDQEAEQLYYTAMAALRAGDLMSEDLADKLAGLFNKPAKPDNGGSTEGGNDQGNTIGGENVPVLPDITEDTTLEEIMSDPEIKETVDTLAEALSKVDDFTAIISKDTVEQLMQENGADVSEVTEEDKEMVKDYVNEYIENFECTPEEKEKLESNIQDLLNMIGLDINLGK